MAAGQINMRDARVDDVDHVSDSDNDEKEEPGPNNGASDAFTVGVFPTHQSPIYLHFASKQEKVRKHYRKSGNIYLHRCCHRTNNNMGIMQYFCVVGLSIFCFYSEIKLCTKLECLSLTDTETK